MAMRRQSRSQEHPEDEVIGLATRLVILAKLSGVVGSLAFIWATVVLLGGLLIGAITTLDFWLITFLLVLGGVRVLIGTQEFEWQRVLAKSFPRSRCGAQTTYSRAEDIENAAQPGPEAVSAVTVSVYFLPVQVSFALLSLSLAMFRMIKHDFGKKRYSANRDRVLYIYYGLTVIEVLIFLFHRVYHVIKMRDGKLFTSVAKKYDLDDKQLVSKFYDYVYSSSLNSRFEGIGKDLIDFSMEKIQSSSYVDQLAGVQIMAALLKHNASEDQTIVSIKEMRARKIGTTPHVLERLLDMLTWRYTEIVIGAATVLNELVYHRIIGSRIAAITWGLEAIASVIIIKPESPEDSWEFKHFALKMLKKLAEEHRCCVMIGQIRGLIAALVDTIDVACLRDNESKDIKICERSLQILKSLAQTTGESAKQVRKDIVKQRLALDKLRDILICGQDRFQEYALDILKGLALESVGRDAIGNTGHAITHLLHLFTGDQKQSPTTGDQKQSLTTRDQKQSLTTGDRDQSLTAASLLNRLARHNPKNCNVIAEFHNIIDQLENGKTVEISTSAAKILRSVCAHVPSRKAKKLAKKTMTHVMARIKKIILDMQKADSRKLEKDKQLENELLEAYLGLAAFTVSAIEPEPPEESGSSNVPEPAKAEPFKGIVEALSSLLPKLQFPSVELPRIRRHAVELVIQLMKKDKSFHTGFKKHAENRNHLEAMSKNVSEMENYHFSGTTGIDQYHERIEDLFKSALKYFDLKELPSKKKEDQQPSRCPCIKKNRECPCLRSEEEEEEEEDEEEEEKNK